MELYTRMCINFAQSFVYVNRISGTRAVVSDFSETA